MKSIRQLFVGLLTAVSSTIIVLAAASLALLEGGGAGGLSAGILTPQVATEVIPLSTPTVNLTPVQLPSAVLSSPTPTITPQVTIPHCKETPADWKPYIILPGDTIDALAAQYMQSPQTILKANCLTVPALVAGSVLYLPGTVLTATPSATSTFPPPPTAIPCSGPPPGWVAYIVRQGDTLFRLSVVLGVSQYQLQAANCIVGTETIYAGQVLYVPFLPPTPVPTKTVTPTQTLTHTPVTPTTAVPTITHTPTKQTKATVTLSGLDAVFDGTPKSVGVTTSPAGLNVTVTYNGASTPPTAAGSYAVVATVNDPSYQGSASGTLVIAKATASITLGGLAQIYGASQSVTATTNPAGLNVAITFSGSAAQPTNAGTYSVEANITDPNYQGSTSGTLTIAQADAVVSLNCPAATEDGSPHGASAATTPAGLAVTITYDGFPTQPTKAGSYLVVATVNETNYKGSASCTLVIAPAAPPPAPAPTR